MYVYIAAAAAAVADDRMCLGDRPRHHLPPERFAVCLVDRAALTSDTYSEHFVENSHVHLYSKRPFVFIDRVFFA